LKAVHRDYRAQLLDRFADTTVDSSVVGKSFKIVVPLHNGDALGGHPGPWYSYNDGTLRLVFTLSDLYQSSGYKGPRYLTGVFGGSRTPVRSYTGSNAYGATARVQVEKLVQNGVAFMSGPKGERPIENDQNMGEFIRSLGRGSNYSTELKLPGSQARRVALDSALIIEGAIANLPDAKLSGCKGMYGDATLDHPIELYGETCWVGANVRRVAFVRVSSGEVLEEWENSASSPQP
jgi:hypothetical protein